MRQLTMGVTFDGTSTFGPPAWGAADGVQTMTEKYDLPRRKVLGGLATIGVAGAGVGLGTSALYSDTEQFVNNQITAGTSNLAVTLGLVEVQSTASASDLDINFDVDESRTADGEVVTGIQVGDMKPGDCILIRTTVDVEDNPMYVAVQSSNAADDEGANPEPEPQPGVDDDSDAIPGGGDLDNLLDVRMGWDDDRGNLHDNNLEGNIVTESGINGTSLTDFLGQLSSGFLYRGRNDASGSPPGGHGDGEADPTRIGDTSQTNADRDAVTHFIELCLPTEVGNQVQGDSVSFDLEWSSEQVRNNPDPSSAEDVDGSANSS